MISAFQTLSVWFNQISSSCLTWINSFGAYQILLSVAIFGIFSVSVIVPIFSNSASDKIVKRKDK